MRSWFAKAALAAILLAAAPASAQLRIDQLSAGAAVQGTDVIANCQGCGAGTAAVKTTVTNLVTYLSGVTQTLTNKTLTSPTINAGALSGTFTGTPTFSGDLIFSGDPQFTGLNSGTQVSCLGLDSGNTVVLSAAACGSGGGSGDVTASGTLTASRLILGGGTTVVSALGSLGTTTTVLHGNAAGAPTFGAVAIGTDVSGLGTGIATALAVNTGSAGAPVLLNGALGTPSSGTLTSATGLPVATGISGLGTGVATALAVNVGSAGAPVVLGGALGTPSSGTGTNITGIPNNNVLGVTLATGTSVTLTAPREYYICTGTCTVTPPVPAAGHEFCVRNDNNVATVITMAAIGTSARYENQAHTAYGTAGTGTLVSAGAVGDQVCLIGLDSTHYLFASGTGTWTAN